MNKTHPIDAVRETIRLEMLARGRFREFVRTYAAFPVAQLLEHVAAGYSTLQCLAEHLGQSEDVLIPRLVSLRLHIYDVAPADPISDRFSQAWQMDELPRTISTLAELACFLDTIPEVSAGIPEDVMDRELERLGITVDENRLKALLYDAHARIAQRTLAKVVPLEVGSLNQIRRRNRAPTRSFQPSSRLKMAASGQDTNQSLQPLHGCAFELDIGSGSTPQYIVITFLVDETTDQMFLDGIADQAPHTLSVGGETHALVWDPVTRTHKLDPPIRMGDLDDAMEMMNHQDVFDIK
jgi:hypothetical protein